MADANHTVFAKRLRAAAKELGFQMRACREAYADARCDFEDVPRGKAITYFVFIMETNGEMHILETGGFIDRELTRKLHDDLLMWLAEESQEIEDDEDEVGSVEWVERLPWEVLH